MRKITALAMVALLSLAVAFAAMGCSQSQETTTETTPPPSDAMMDTSMMGDTIMHADSMMH